ncbi:hypothetical protein M5689_011095 [Euphorbia peplus]|nr:hypothetical protein M5689_011095 [Euphorbia peplus]
MTSRKTTFSGQTTPSNNLPSAPLPIKTLTQPPPTIAGPHPSTKTQVSSPHYRSQTTTPYSSLVNPQFRPRRKRFR